MILKSGLIYAIENAAIIITDRKPLCLAIKTSTKGEAGYYSLLISIDYQVKALH